MSGSSPPSIQCGLNGFAVPDQEGGPPARRASPAARRRRRRRDRVAVPVGEQRNLDAERLRPRAVRPRRVSRDRERAHADPVKIVAPVPQEVQLVRSSGRPVADVEAEERETRPEHLPQRSRLLAGAVQISTSGTAIAGPSTSTNVPGHRGTSDPTAAGCDQRFRAVDRADAVVVGAGVVGLAVARALAIAGREVVILEAEDAIGKHTSSRNSEVIHAGIYYPQGSLKARTCVEGRQRLYAYCAERACRTSAAAS